ncbi:MAG TPA: hypothetical protein VK154_14285 [Chitinophagales bacterium]|nr:hypothetical protein [Chitinophagales bacterium]
MKVTEMKNKRIVIVGTSGSGKSTLARKLAAKHGIKHIELDVLYWQPNWTETPMPQFLQKIEKAMAQNPNWVICGNYNVAKKLTLPAATDIVWLDYPLYKNFWRGFKRSLGRMISKEECFDGCSESFALTFLSRKSILLWILKTHKLRRETFSKLLTKETFQQAEIYRVQNERECERVLNIV